MEDQLRASEGWVRCGHCRQIFDALERLFQLEDAAAEPAGASPVRASSTPEFPPSQTAGTVPAPRGDHLIEPDVAWAETRPAMFGEEHLLLPSGTEAAAALTNESPSVTAADEKVLLGTEKADTPTTQTFLTQTPDDPAQTEGATETPEAHRTELTFTAAPPSAAATSEDAGPSTQPLPLSFVDTTTGEENATAPETELRESSTTAGAEVSADSSTLFLIEDVGADKDAEAAKAHELIQELEPSQAALQQVAQRSAEAAAGELSSSRSGGRNSSRKRPSSGNSSHRGSSASSLAEPSVPAFVRRADSKARWQRPWVRFSLALVAAGSALALSAQAAVQWHDLIGARSPALRPLVQELCRTTTGCVLEPPRIIDGVAVESSSLTHPSDLIGYRLNVLIHNRLDHEITPPHLELTLTDISGAVLVRRVLKPADFGMTQSALEAQSESAWQLDFGYDTPAISGYTVRAFYP
jgi:hypothetical protein